MSKKVTYAEIIEALSRETGFSKLKSEAFTKALIRQVKSDLQETGKASITNFGSFKVKEVAERQGQNPQTGEPITIPAHKRVSFTPYKALKEGVNANYAHLETELIEEQEETPTYLLQENKREPEPETEMRPEPESEPEPEQESELEPDPEPEPEPEPELEPEPGLPPASSRRPDIFASKTMKRDRTQGKNLGLIIVAALGLTIIAIASVWFLMSSDEDELATDQSAVEQPQTPPSEAQLVQDESDEAVETDNQEQQAEPVDHPAVTQQSQQETQRTTDEQVNTSGYTVSEDEWYWVISRNVYGKSHFWPLIFKQNFSVDHHPDSLEKNVRLEVPALEGSSENPTKGDYRRLASAAKMVSDAYLKHGRTDKAEEYARFASRWEEAGKE